MGPGGIGIAAIAAGFIPPTTSRFILQSTGSVERLATVTCGALLVLVALPFLYAALRAQPVINVDDTGSAIWHMGRVKHISWSCVAGLRLRTAGWADVLEVVPTNGRALGVSHRALPCSVVEARRILFQRLQKARPDDWRAVASG